jgi:hypothetical protein
VEVAHAATRKRKESKPSLVMESLGIVDIISVAKVVKIFQVFTEPMSIFTRGDDTLTACACFVEAIQEIYFLIGNRSFSLLYCASLREDDLEVALEQIVSIKQPKEVHIIHEKQILAISNTQALVFQRNPYECEDLKEFFTPGCTKKQSKKLIGKSIDFKVNFEQLIYSV